MMLTVIALNFVIGDAIPKIGYATWMHVHVAVCYGVLILIFGMFLAEASNVEEDAEALAALEEEGAGRVTLAVYADLDEDTIPTLLVLLVFIAIVLTGLGFAFAEGGSALRKGIGIVFGLAIAFTATTFISTFFNMTAGAAF